MGKFADLVPAPKFADVVPIMRREQAKSDPIFADMIYRYIREISASRELGVSQRCAMEKAARLPLGATPLSDLNSEAFVNLALLLSKDHDDYEHTAVQRQTITQYFVYLGLVVDMMKLWKTHRAKEIAEQFDEAKLWLDKLHLLGKGRPREQRMSPEQQATIEAFFTAQESDWAAHVEAPMVKVMNFALTSLKRQSEIMRVKWSDLDVDQRMLTVRDMKDPRFKKGNDFRFPLIRGAFEIVMSMPRVDERIFPYNAHSLSQRWHDAMMRLGFPIHFHDMRREGICRMLAEGYGPAEIAAVSGHKNWNTLARVYGNKFDPTDLHRGPAAARARATEQRVTA